MLNHTRTLLMNVDGSVPKMNYYAEEIVDPSYKALDLPTSVDTIRTVLFGTNPDRDMLNYRCRQLLAVAHATPLERYLTTFDPRITYDFSDTALVEPEPWIATVDTAGSATLAVSDTPDPPDSIGRIRHEFTVKVDAPGVVTVTRTTVPVSIVVLNFDTNTRVPLTGSGCTARLSSTSAPQTHRVSIYVRPQRSLADLMASVAKVGEPALIDVFGLSRDEPRNTFREIWNRCPELPLRVGALVCALMYRCEEVRV